MSSRRALFLILILFAAPAGAAVPDRVTYQGRLSKSGVSVSGEHVFVVRLLSSGGQPLWSSGNLTVTLPATGEFSLTIEPTGVDWLSADPRVEISVDGDTLSPADYFSTTPYAFVARQVEDGSVSTAKLAAGAVTDDKVASGLSSAKILLNGSSPAAVLSSWQSSTAPHLIDGSKVSGTVLPGAHATNHALGQGDPVTLDRTQITGTAVVAAGSATQTLQPTANVVPLRVQANAGASAAIAIAEFKGPSGDDELVVRGTGDLEAAGRVKDASGFVTPVGGVLAYAGASAPSGWLLCDGSAVSRSTYADLFAAIGVVFGAGDGSSTFNLPDLRQRFPLGKAASGTGAALGSSGGGIDHAHSVPAHYHGMGAGADLNITASGNHGHQLFAREGGVAGSDFRVMLSGTGTGNAVNMAAGTTINNTGDLHVHGSGSIGGSIGTVSGGVSGNAAMTTGSHNPPFLALNYIIKY